MKSSRVLLSLSAVFSLAFLLSGPSASDLMAVVKAGSIVFLAFLGFRVDKRLGTALTFGAFGDVLLGVHRLGALDAEKLFLFGLAAFLLGHLVYIVMFCQYRARDSRKPSLTRALGVLAIPVVLASMLATLWHSFGPLLVPVIAYAVVLGGMATSAVMADLGNPLAAIGALFFVASDTMLALSKFHGSFPGHGPLIWMTYYLAQLLIFLGIDRHCRKPTCPPANTASEIAQQ